MPLSVPMFLYFSACISVSLLYSYLCSFIFFPFMARCDVPWCGVMCCVVLCRRRIWDELSPKWPRAYWDDWLREPAQRLCRQVIRPEVCRTLHFGALGVSNAQFSDVSRHPPQPWIGVCIRVYEYYSCCIVLLIFSLEDISLTTKLNTLATMVLF